MSGICGIWRLDGAPPTGISAMTAQMHRRGPEGARIRQNGPLAFGHCLLTTTPEAAHEVQPLTHSPTGCILTADLRLDNRETLIAALAPGARKIGDAELVLLAFLRWGEECPNYLQGDFAFAVYDPRAQKLFAARDRMGLKQLIWSYSEGRIFAFASEAEAVVRAEGIALRLNEGRVGDFLVEHLEAIDQTSTFFADVFRLPPAHSLRLDTKGLDIRRYWRLEPPAPLRLRSDAEYNDAFREVLDRAIARRLRAPAGRVGSTLSGGMDSGSIVALAAQQFAQAGRGPLPTFSATGPDPEACVETQAIHQALTMPNLSPSLANWGDLGALLPRLQQTLFEVAEPFDAHMNILRALCLMAQDRGLSVLLAGPAGDVALTSGPWMGQLLRQGRLWQLWREAKGQSQFWGKPWKPSYFLEQAARQALVPHWARLWKHRRDLHRLQNVVPYRLTAEGAKALEIGNRLVRDQMQNRPERLDFAAHRARSMMHNSLTVGLERYDRILGRFGLELRDPYTDPAVLELCLSLPGDQLQRNGWLKFIQRQSVAGLLPDSVRWRHGKEHLGWDFTRAVCWDLPDRLASMPPEVEKITRFINPETLNSGQAGPDSVNDLAEMQVLLSCIARMAEAGPSIIRPSEEN